MLELRTFEGELEVRSSKREIIGRAVPYGVEMQITPRLIEAFNRGSFDLGNLEGMRFSRGHITSQAGLEVCGQLVEARDAADGLYVTLRASETALGDDTLELIKDGTLKDLSIGFEALQDRRAPSQKVRNRECVWRDKARLDHVAAVLRGAYGEHARVLTVREETEPFVFDLPRVLPLPRIH